MCELRECANYPHIEVNVEAYNCANNDSVNYPRCANKQGSDYPDFTVFTTTRTPDPQLCKHHSAPFSTKQLQTHKSNKHNFTKYKNKISLLLVYMIQTVDHSLCIPAGLGS